MSGYFAAGRLSEDEKSDILKLHSSVYNGYRTMQPKVNNEQPLYVYDPAQDKVGAVMNNKGVVKPYTNFGINEQTEQKDVCEECGSMMTEGECSECGWKGDVGNMDEQDDQQEPSFMDRVQDTAKDVGMFVVSNPEILAALEEDENSKPHKTHRRTGKFKKHQYTEDEVSEYETGHLDDIYDVQDLNPNAEFDYVKGASNKTNAFHVKEQSEDYIDNFEDTDNEDDGYEDINASEVTDEIEEQGGNADDMNVSDVKEPFDFESNGPMAGGDVYPTESEMDEEECDECWEKMESAWSEEIDETDVSGVQGIYGAMEPAFDFDSEGPGKAGPYQHSQYSENHGEDEDAYWEKDLEDDELDLDFEKFNPRDKSWEEITAHTGEDEFSHLDEDIVESVVNQKNKIMEMMNRMKVFK